MPSTSPTHNNTPPASRPSPSFSNLSSPPLPSSSSGLVARSQIPTPALSRPPSAHIATPDSRYPPLRSDPTTPPPHWPQSFSSRTPRTPSTLSRAINTALPTSPNISAPSSSYRLREAVELSPISQYRRTGSNRQLDSPFDDRHSIALEEMSAIDRGDDYNLYEYHKGEDHERTKSGYVLSSPKPRVISESWAEETLNEVQVSNQRRSLYPTATFMIPESILEDHPDLASPTISVVPPRTMKLAPIGPSFVRLFTLSSVRDRIIYLAPALAFSIASALVPPYMTVVIGDAFTAFEAYPLETSLATSEQKSILMSGVASTSLKLTVAGLVAIVFGYMKTVTWFRFSEGVTACLRRMVFDGVQRKSMEWFDLGMGMRETEKIGSESVGAGGLMAKFTRETDDVRLATALASGNAIQFFFTFFICFILAMVKEPVLAIITLSTVPLIVLVNIITQVLAQPLYTIERRAFAEASTNVERATSAIATVKAHNAQASEESRFESLVNGARESLVKQGAVWATCLGTSDFFLLSMFVVGFWYGAKVVSEGRSSVGNVMTVFWACLLASSNLQMIVPQLTVVTKGKNSLASLLTIIQPDTENDLVSNAVSRRSPTFSYNAPTLQQSIRRIRPPRCRGEVDLKEISFSYPSRPEFRVLRGVTIFIPPGETTFIVGGSGSGKSTVAQLLLRLYPPSQGKIMLDDQSLAYLDEEFTRQHIAAVQQGCILFDMTVHDNVAMGLAGAGPDAKGNVRRPSDVTRDEVITACTMASIHKFIESLPEGYETRLGTGGSHLSGGQRQRLAIARARIRDPTVLILDEATSALDATSRVVVFEAMKQWRTNRTTIVITHDLSQISDQDFVYVMKDGIVAEQGFRSDLMRKSAAYGVQTGVFAAMAVEQALQPLPPKHVGEWHDASGVEEILDREIDDNNRLQVHRSSFQGLRPASVMYLDILEDYSRRNSVDFDHRSTRGSLTAVESGAPQSPRPMSLAQKRLSWSPQELNRRVSRASFNVGSHPPSRAASRISHRKSSEPRASFTEKLGYLHRLDVTLSQNLEDELKAIEVEDLSAIVKAGAPTISPVDEPVPSLFKMFIHFYPTVPDKHFLFFGIIGSVCHGIATPVWSSFISKLMALVGTGSMNEITKNGGILLAVCFGQAVADWAQEYCLQTVAARWTAHVRSQAFGRVLAQDKAWFDEPAHSPARLVQCLIKDADDMRFLMANVLGRMVVVIVMISLGLIWAMIVGWQLSLVGIALTPVFAAIILVTDMLMGKYEVVNKSKREAVARTFYESVANIRGIRAMALEASFRDRFEMDAISAKHSGRNAAWLISTGLGVSSAMPLFAQALMNFVGALFMKNGIMNYETMLEVYTLVLFSLTFSTQMLDFMPLLTKAKVASRDFDRLLSLSIDTAEKCGDLRFPITGNIHFDQVSFAYPTRPDVPIFSSLSLTLNPGECVAIVGPSGSGKSTLAAILQRLYEPTGGKVGLDRFVLHDAEVKWLRNHIAVVSQTANLFDATVAENIAYGSEVPLGEIHSAAKSANIHDFIQGLPDGYDTNLGENAALISGGQAQRLQIARALVRRSSILILDECTSALDVDNQRAILDTIIKIKDTRTTIFITHSIEVMRRCNRVVCLGDGKVAEDGSFEELVARGGIFAQLMMTGEWE